MRVQSSATASAPIAVPAESEHRGRGTAQAALGVAAFSLTFPATAWGLEGFGPWSLTALRGVVAALVAGACLLLAGRRPGGRETGTAAEGLRVGPGTAAEGLRGSGSPAEGLRLGSGRTARDGLRGTGRRVRLPERRHLPGLAVVAAGVVLGFPLLTTLALQTSTTAHAAVVVGLLPLTTAAFSALRGGTRHSRRFWAAALAGAAAVLAFTLAQNGGALTAADGFLFAALVVCAAGYTEGGRLARVMPGWQVIGWALVLCLPLSVPGAALALAYEPVRPGVHGAVGLLWVAVGSQFLGLLLWYRGMAAVGVARASQLQLAQPLLTLVWSALLLGEHLTAAAPLTAVAVLVCIAVTQRS
ncbi:DMT family transporter [Streptomyces sp. NPDC090108]|uniref:DMT family transporter n=1 Tax=Streptomyces sp. NPDC090108 TaxID=3365947 RepID=UPI00380EAA8F